METNIITQEDLNFLAQQSAGKLNMILSGMTALMRDTDNKVEMLESQTWFQRMARTITGRNKMTQQEIQRNHDKINAYMTEAMTELYKQNCIDRQIMMSLGNQLNEIYAEHLQLKQMLGVFVTKLNEKIESVDNFHMLNTEIEQGVYSSCSSLVGICKILSQMDKRCVQDTRKLEIIKRSMIAKNIINANEYTLADYLKQITEIPMDEIGVIYVEIGTIRGNFMANIILSIIENYHFLPDMARKLKNKNAVIEDVILQEKLEPTISLTVEDIYQEFINSKIDMVNGLLPISEIQYDTKMQEAVELFLDYKLDEAFEIFKTLAEKGNGRAMYFMGEYYAQPYGKVMKDSALAREWRIKGKDAGDVLAFLNVAYSYPKDSTEREQIFNQIFEQVLQLAENGDVFAQNEIADMYGFGYGIHVDKEKRKKWLNKSAEQGYWRSLGKLGDYYWDEENYEEALKWYRIGAEKNDPFCQNAIGNCYHNGFGVARDFVESVRWYEKAVEQNYIWALSNLGNMYRNGRGVAKDSYKAIELYQRAYEIGNAEAANWIGVMYYNGDGVPEDNEKEFLWIKRSAELGYAQAQCNLGNCYYAGRGVEQNYEEAYKWYLLSAENGCADGQQHVANCLYEGNGCIKDDKESFIWSKNAAEQGDAEAQNMLAYYYQHGIGAEIDMETGFYWFKKSAENGSEKGQDNLAICYRYGYGTSIDNDLAKFWVTKSAEQGRENAIKNLENWFGIRI